MMTRDEIRDRCCVGADDTELQREAFAIAADWYRQFPPSVGGLVRDLTRHQKKCQRYVVATIRERAASRETGFGFDPASIFLIWQIVSMLWSLWEAFCGDSENTKSGQ